MVEVTVRAARSMSVTSPSTTRVFSWRRRISRVAAAISPSERMPVATWVSSGWDRWWLVLPMTVTSTGALRSAWAVNRPPKPVPMMTTCGRPLEDSFADGTRADDVVMMNPSFHLAVPRPPLGGSDPGHSLTGDGPARGSERGVGSLAVGAAPYRGVPLPHPGSRRRLEPAETGLRPVGWGVVPGEDPGGLAGRAVGDVLAGRGHEHRPAEDARCELLHRRGPCAAADEQHPLHAHPLRDHRVDSVGQPAQESFHRRPRPVRRRGRPQRQAVHRAGAAGEVRRPLALQVGDQD